MTHPYIHIHKHNNKPRHILYPLTSITVYLLVHNININTLIYNIRVYRPRYFTRYSDSTVRYRRMFRKRHTHTKNDI